MQNWILAAEYPVNSRIRVLDLGTEYGHSGDNIKEHFPKAIIDGVEIHPPTYRACLEDRGKVYHRIYLEDCLSFLEKRPTIHWNVILAAEIIEHMTKDDGLALLDLAKERSDLVIVTSPIGFVEHGALDDNLYQRHISGWEPTEMEDLGYRTFALMPIGFTQGIYFWSRRGRL